MMIVKEIIEEKIGNIIVEIEKLDLQEKISAINKIKIALHEISPFKNEPVDCVLWIESEKIKANDYNPNVVAPPEMKLLQHSIQEDGYTQPIVSWQKRDNQEVIGEIIDNTFYEVVDGFHRNRVGREIKEIKERICGYLPITIINSTREDRGDRISSTIRHNRARGKHSIDGMAEIVIELKRRNWSDEKISRELGMDPDEILRLCQITGLAEMFANKEFSEAWEAQQINEVDNLEITEEDEKGLSSL